MSNQSLFQPAKVNIGDVSVGESLNIRITRVPVSALTEQPFSIIAGCRQLTVKTSEPTAFRASFDLNGTANSSTTYVTLKKGFGFSLSAIKFSGKIVYVRPETACTFEIVELY